MFPDIKKQIEENNKRWEQINSLLDNLHKQINTSTDPAIPIMAKIISLLTEQLKPLSATEGPEVLDSMQQILDKLSGVKQ